MCRCDSSKLCERYEKPLNIYHREDIRNKTEGIQSKEGELNHNILPPDDTETEKTPEKNRR